MAVRTVTMRTEDLKILRVKIQEANPAMRVEEDVEGRAFTISCQHGPVLAAYESAPDKWLVAGSAVA